MSESGSIEKIKALFRAIDKDKSGTLSVPEILMWAAVKQKGSRKEKIRMAFRAFDADGSGTIGEDELIQILTTQGDHSKDSASRLADQIIRSFDRDGNRELDLQEFEMAAMSYPEVAKLFVGEDTVHAELDSGDYGYGYDEEDGYDEDEDGEEDREWKLAAVAAAKQGRGGGEQRR